MPSLDPNLYSPVRGRDPKRREMVDEMLRVDHAGEVGAVQIYEGQMWALRGNAKDYNMIKVRASRGFIMRSGSMIAGVVRRAWLS